MSKMAEMDMMVQEVVKMANDTGCSVLGATAKVAKEWGLNVEELGMVFDEAVIIVYPPTV